MNTQAFRGTQSQAGGFTLGNDYGLDYFQTQQLQSQQVSNSYADFPALGQFSQVEYQPTELLPADPSAGSSGLDVARVCRM